jgi:hypothetical protein
MISYSTSGGGETQAWLKRIMKLDFKGLDGLAARGVDALRAATPRESGMTAEMWRYEIVREDGVTTIWFINDHVEGGHFNVAVGLQYGHATGTGGWVDGYDYINPALRPVFDMIADEVWKEVQR